jgi:hypothetical protein
MLKENECVWKYRDIRCTIPVFHKKECVIPLKVDPLKPELIDLCRVACLIGREKERERERELGIGIRAGEKKSLGMGDSLLWKGGGGRKHNLLLEGSQVTPVVLKPEFRYLIFKVAVYTPQKTKLRLHYKHSLANAV